MMIRIISVIKAAPYLSNQPPQLAVPSSSRCELSLSTPEAFREDCDRLLWCKYGGKACS